MLRTSWRNFLRTKRIFFPALAAAAGLTGCILYQGIQFGLHKNVLGFAGELQQACAPLFLLELYLSYEFLHAVRHSGLEEAVSAIPQGKPRLYAAPLAVLLCLAAVFFLVTETACALLGLVAQAPGMYFSHTLAVNTLNTLAAGALAVLTGGLLACATQRSTVYGLLALLGFWMLPVSDLVPGILNDSYHINIWPAKALFSWVLPRQHHLEHRLSVRHLLRGMAVGFGGPVAVLSLDSNGVAASSGQRTPHRWERVSGLLGWVSSSFCPRGQPDRPHSLPHQRVPGGCRLLLSKLPPGRRALVPGGLLPDGFTHTPGAFGKSHHGRWKAPHSPSIPLPCTTATRWPKLPMKPATPCPSPGRGDYLTVTPQGELSSLTVEYAGSSPMFYSGSQGVCLPGCFPYYPWAGYRKIFYAEPDDGIGLSSFIPRTDLPQSDFTVTVTGGKNLQASLPEVDGTYQGTAKRVLHSWAGCWNLKRAAPTGW